MPQDNIREQLVAYLRDAHATEENALKQLRTGADSVSKPELAAVLRQHLRETEEHEQLVRERLEAYDAGPSALKDLASKGGALATGAVAKAAPDTSGKIAIQAYAFEHLEIASYRMLHRVAVQAGDEATARVAGRILEQERAAAAKLDGLLEDVAEHDLHQQGVAA
jgi:ferritin-like metal-binding protein YciE